MSPTIAALRRLGPRARATGERSRAGAVDQRRLRIQSFALTTVLAAAVLATFAPRRAEAVALDEPHVGGIGFSGPTTGDLAAVYWNPAALGLMHGINVTAAGTMRLSTTTVARAPLTDGTTFAETRAHDRSQPFMWPAGPGAFLGVGYDVGGDRLSIAAAIYMPFLDRTSYQAPPGQPLPTRYHRASADLRNLAIVPAVAFRIAGDFRLGFAPGVLLSTGKLSFSESTCAADGTCAGVDNEDPTADAQLDLGSSQSILSSSGALTLAGGMYYKRRAWEFGLSFSSRPLGNFGGSSTIVGEQSQITRAPRDAAAESPALVTCENQRADGRGCVFADITYKLPYTLIGSVAWHPRPGLELTAIMRVLSFPEDDVINIRLTGATFSDTGVPAHIVLYRGYGTVVDTRLRVAGWVTERVRVGGGVRFESSALPANAVSPAAVDNRKIEPTVMVQAQPIRHLWFTAGYGFMFMLPVTASTSVFEPGAAAGCAAAGGDLTARDCMLRREGMARATAAGTYRRFEHNFSLSMTAQF